MTSRQIPTQPCKSVLSTLPPYFLQVHVSARDNLFLGAKWIYDVYEQSYVFLAVPC